MLRPPVVTILGHVDHGKTTLLDYIRKSQVAAKEHGGITQRIGAYEIKTGIKGYENDRITFIDTPGHEAFSKMRSRGASVADIAVLVIDAKDSVMPQTAESISHIKAAKIPLIVVINKIDLPDAKPERVKRDLLKHEVLAEEHGGDVIVLLISAKTGKGVPELLESILLLSSDKGLTCDLDKSVKAYIIETNKDKRGVVVSAVIKDGTLNVGDEVYASDQKIKVRAMISDTGSSLKQVIPSTPFQILGFNELPQVGTLITSEKPTPAKAPEDMPEAKPAETKSVLEMLQAPEEAKKLSLIIKADSHGSLEAIVQALSQNENIEVVLSAVGSIHRSDIFLAKTTKSIVIGFSVPIDNEVKQLAKQEKVLIKTYSIIYELLEELAEVSDLMHEKEERDKNLKAEAKVLAAFIIENEKVFGCRITKGRVNLGDPVEQYRKNEKIAKSKLVSLKVRVKSVNEVKKDQECGMQFAPELDIKVGDVIKFIL
ncbi:translation initiation factor IF-2 [Candidatus Roizmanbacteria bacterium RIFCSPLOWO2_01_FULL_38_12]|uniref:Translation initiation factor IF-2 n=1 Tax=Candidatus Roizmanbacteria bacterium RIFCSPLOWO2_01_FULL_38_12 TaxID=1802061 RepID=A0A1F7IXU9_9BACT|nr:MAG: translation initiation factor IF-2 [Candidatus Roizmanbacteria bacterium RIFCSPHIGHO2_01_FULL_38_15]OGK35276.1 MAG: translation initiation factor IF-2 [Candidatus Roizmanbacteria bacterium RIFCSPHIGHO2_12_FULL_38_13]OGK48202.1 MAG: translation initiation factor IF-2 [Candidatus Roizmanbacteria bacterium RIFCSPLOWO2_01_FULL_38_12]